MSQNEEQSLMNHNPLVMNSLGKECQELKHSYDSCFNAWFSEKFLSGSTDMSQCEPLLQLYTKCVKRVMAEKKIDVGAIENGVRKTTTLPTNL